MINIMRAHCKGNMLFAASKVRLITMDTAPVLTPSAPGAIKLYVFKQWGEEFPFATEVTVRKGSRLLTDNTIMIRYKVKSWHWHKHQWMTFKTFLDNSAIPDHMTTTDWYHGSTSDCDCKFQQIWWSNTGQYFRMDKLRSEICRKIYRDALGQNTYPHVSNNIVGIGYIPTDPHRHCVRNEPEGLDEEDVVPRSNRPNYALLHVLNHRLQTEALQEIWEAGYKYFVEPGFLSQALQPKVIQPNFNWLNRVQLNFTISDWFRFFGVKIHLEVHIVHEHDMGPLLGGLVNRGLEHLELYFRDPYRINVISDYEDEYTVSPLRRRDRGSNPWEAFYQMKHEEGWFRNDINYSAMERHPCQKTVVEWILTFALHHVKDPVTKPG